MPRYRLTVEYDGTAYHGWERQPGVPTVQAAIEDAIEIVARTRTHVVGSGRTDAGVHARGQVVHFDLHEQVDVFRFAHSLNGVLTPDIAILEAVQTRDDFHARYDARRRRYGYYVSVQSRAIDRRSRARIGPGVDFDSMNAAAKDLVGRHDFSSFCRTQSETRNRVCTVYEAAWQAETRAGDWCFSMEADRFLHGMVRSVVGTLLQVGRGGRETDCMPDILARQDRRAAGPAARAKGLVLEGVGYMDA